MLTDTEVVRMGGPLSVTRINASVREAWNIIRTLIVTDTTSTGSPAVAE